MYKVIFTKDAQKSLKLLHKNAPQAVSKLAALLEELKEHPRTGTGKVEILKYQQGKEIWSRRITREHRLVYTIEDMIVQVQVISVYGHYDK
jgi:toxin YoeB